MCNILVNDFILCHVALLIFLQHIMSLFLYLLMFVHALESEKRGAFIPPPPANSSLKGACRRHHTVGLSSGLSTAFLRYGSATWNA